MKIKKRVEVIAPLFALVRMLLNIHDDLDMLKWNYRLGCGHLNITPSLIQSNSFLQSSIVQIHLSLA